MSKLKIPCEAKKLYADEIDRLCDLQDNTKHSMKISVECLLTMAYDRGVSDGLKQAREAELARSAQTDYSREVDRFLNSHTDADLQYLRDKFGPGAAS